jgi:hypothetical protein
VTFLVGVEKAEVHKFILKIGSPVFEKFFNEEGKSSYQPLLLGGSKFFGQWGKNFVLQSSKIHAILRLFPLYNFFFKISKKKYVSTQNFEKNEKIFPRTLESRKRIIGVEKS